MGEDTPQHLSIGRVDISIPIADAAARLGSIINNFCDRYFYFTQSLQKNRFTQIRMADEPPDSTLRGTPAVFSEK
ncbi:hypothetical protein [Allocoleopsis sp.]|uniref:hypothetical protein n=1 Tax=Allocoleopsis sp. TaxID=3088169 RepID=UPI002FD7089D